MTKSILIVAAHPDDEVLGCGGTVARHVHRGDVVHAVFMTDGVSARGKADDAARESRLNAAARAHEVLGIESSVFLDFPDNGLDSVPLLDIVQRLEEVVGKISPHVIYTHHQSDLNIDHCITYRAVMTCCRPLPGSAVTEIYSFEVLSSTEWALSKELGFCPNYHVDITPFMETKIAALNAYGMEMRDSPHARSIEHSRALAIHRGHSVGLDFAEGFQVERIVQKL